MRPKVTFGLVSIGIGLLLVAGPAFGLQFGGVSSASIAQGNVYDVYGTNALGQTSLIASCQSFATYLADSQSPAYQAQYPNGISSVPDSACGPIILVTSTTASGTTFTNAQTSCPPILPGYAVICNGTTYTNTATTTSTVTLTTTSTSVISTTTMPTLTTSTAIVTQNGGTATKVVTTTVSPGGGSILSLYPSQLIGILFAGLGLAMIVRKRL